MDIDPSAPRLTGGPSLLTLGPHSAAVRAARRFVEEQLAGTGLDAVAEDAGLLAAELAANAVLHARSPFDVVVHRADRGARVEVRDRSTTLPVLTAPSATAMSGRGLRLVRALATSWGCEELPSGGKSVWFEVSSSPVQAGPDLGVDELLAAWADEEPVPQVPVPRPGSTTTGVTTAGSGVVAVEVLVARDLLAAKESLDDLLRELQLVLLDADDPEHGRLPEPRRTAGWLATARRLDACARAFDGIRSQVREQLTRAVTAGHDRVTLRLETSPGDREAATAYRAALEAAESLPADGSLLTTARRPAHEAATRRAYLEEFVRAAAVL